MRSSVRHNPLTPDANLSANRQRVINVMFNLSFDLTTLLAALAGIVTLPVSLILTTGAAQQVLRR